MTTKAAFTRTELMLGDEGMEKLTNSFVVLAGVGAVGGFALEALVRAGVGRIRIIDFDVVEESNLNRQILATRDTLGKVKVELAEKRAKSINPEIRIEVLKAFISPDHIKEVLCGSPDLLIDAIDTITAKVTLLKSAAQMGIRTFSSMGAALRTETSMIKVAPLSKTKVCPLAAAIRSNLRKQADMASILDKITCVYSEEPVTVVPTERNDSGKSVLGSLPTIPAIFGLTLANEAIKYIVKKSLK